MGRTSIRQTEMDQFMNDFLEGKYIDDAPSTKDRVPSKPHRKSLGEAHGDGAPPTRGVRRTKSNDDSPFHVRDDGRFVRRSKSGGGKRKSSKNQEKLDPQVVLRMLEMYASLDNSEKADEYLHYNSDRRSSSTSTSSATRKSLIPVVLPVVWSDNSKEP